METESRPSSTSPVPSNANQLTVRLLMLGKEVGSIIGKEGKNVKRFREESGARINISDSSSPERIVTLVGSVESISSAFRMICTKFLEDMDLGVQGGNPNEMWSIPLTVRLLVQACQCGCLIGKGGTKIKELRQITGASIQVASDVLPNSTERTITVSGTFEQITRCFEFISQMLLESPPKGPAVPYRPRGVLSANAANVLGNGFVQTQGAMRPSPVVPQTLLISNNGAAPFILPNQFPLSPITQNDLTKLTQLQQTLNGAAVSNNGTSQMMGNAGPQVALQGLPHSVLTGGPLLNLGAVLRNVNMMNANGHMPNAPPVAPQQSHEIQIPNDWIGCVIGRGGVKINEIRQLSGAVIKISPCEDGKKERNITITGTSDAINVALYLIQTRIQAELLASSGLMV